MHHLKFTTPHMPNPVNDVVESLDDFVGALPVGSKLPVTTLGATWLLYSFFLVHFPLRTPIFFLFKFTFITIHDQ